MNLMRCLVEIGNRLLCHWKRNRKNSSPAPGIVKVNLGCGLAVAKGWINIDGSLNALIASFPGVVHRIAYRTTGANRYYSRDEYCSLLRGHQFLHHDLSHGIPFRDESVDFIFSSHFLEHLFKSKAAHLLNESFRVLKQGGRIRVSVPDLSYALSLYQKGDKEKMLESYFFVEDMSNDFSRHKYMYDFELLQALLQETGFEDVTRCSYRSGLLPDLDTLDNRPEDSLFVEAIKRAS